MAQAWDAVTVLRKHKPPTKTSSSESSAKPSNSSSSTFLGPKKSSHANKNKEGIDPRHAAKIDNETEEFKIKKLGIAVGKAIQKGRAEKGLSQKELAFKINEKPSVVVECETGNFVGNSQQILSKMEKVLMIHLRGKDIGSPLSSSSKSKPATTK